MNYFKTLKISEEELEMYNKISLLINDIDILSYKEEDLVRLLSRLRDNLNSVSETNQLILAINEEIEYWWAIIEEQQQIALNDICNYLSNRVENFEWEPTVYEINKFEIISLLIGNTSIFSTVVSMFNNFEECSYTQSPEERAEILAKTWNTIINYYQKNKIDGENDFTPYFCNIFDYYNISNYTDKC